MRVIVVVEASLKRALLSVALRGVFVPMTVAA
jgi:hypothetical protein